MNTVNKPFRKKDAMYPLTSVIIFIIPIKLRNCN